MRANGKIKRAFAAALAAVFALPLLWSVPRGVRASVAADVKMSVSLGDGIEVRYLVDLPDGWRDAQASVNGEALSSPQPTEEGVLFTYRGADALSATEKLHAEVTAVGGNGREKVGEKDYSLADYWHRAFDLSKEREQGALSVKERAEYTASAALSANCLWYLSALGAYTGGAQITLTEEEKAALYDYDQTLSDADGKMTAAGEKVRWQGVSVNYGTTSLSYCFETAETDVTVSVQTGNRRAYTLSPVADGNTYSFDTRAIKPTEFCETVKTTVYAGGEEIASAEYSFNRALGARVEESEKEEEKTLARATYALGKAAAWSAYADEDGIYTYLPELNDNGILVAKVFDYRYDDKRMIAEGNLFAPPAVLWLDGKAYGEGGGNADGVSVSYADGAFTLTLDGAKIGTGVYARGADLHIAVRDDSFIVGSVYDSWDGKAADKAASILLSAGKNLFVTGTAGKTLFVSGCGVTANNLSVENVSLQSTITQAGFAGVNAAGDVAVRGGELAVRYAGRKQTAADGIVSGGNVLTEDGSVRSHGFYNGVNLTQYTESETDSGTAYTREGTFTATGSAKVDISAKNAGIAMLPAGLTGETLAHSGNGRVRFAAGQARIEAKYGVAFADFSLGEADVTLCAEGGAGIGYYVGWAFWDGYNVWETGKNVPAKVLSDSGGFQKGKLTIEAEGTATGIITRGMEVNGGTLTANMNSSGAAISVAEENTALSFDNADVFVRYTGGNHHHLIDCGAYAGVTVSLTAWAQIKGYDVAMPVSSYGGAKIDIRGGNFVVYNAQAKLGEWETNAVLVDGSDPIRYRSV